MPAVTGHPDYGTNLQIEGVDVYSGDGAITIKKGFVAITKASACALTLAAPTAGTDDGKVLIIRSETAAAHTVVTPAGILNGASTTGTFAAAIGNSIALQARNGKWWSFNLQGVTIS